MAQEQRPLSVAVDMTFPMRNGGGSGVYARSILKALREQSAVIPDEIAAPEGGTVGTLMWLMLGARRVLKNGPYDLLHCPSFVMPWRSPVPAIVNLYDAAALRYPGDFPLDWQLYNRFVLPVLTRKAAAVITLSAFSRMDVARYYRLPPGKIAVTYLAAQPEYKPQAVEQVRQYRARLGVGDVPLLLSVGAPVGRKNLDLTLRVLANSSKDGPLRRAMLVVSGARVEDWPFYGNWIASHGLASRVVWLGHVPQDQMPLLYACADVLVYPSIYEGFGLPPIEAMSVGTPVVSSTASCMPEILGNAALLVDPTDDAGYAEAIEAILTMQELRASLVEAGKAQVAKYSWERCANETAAVYRRVALRTGTRL